MKKGYNVRIGKMGGQIISRDKALARRSIAVASGFPPPKYIDFCLHFIDAGFSVSIYEARQTCSKYITVSREERKFKVRFSNHRPAKTRELAGDCDFFVGKTHTGIRTTSMAIVATEGFFK